MHAEEKISMDFTYRLKVEKLLFLETVAAAKILEFYVYVLTVRHFKLTESQIVRTLEISVEN